ncbi:MAG: hypothetical protein JXM69_19970 [Anaerolineae bacterium]|nr:hypothetical protein [Anaerolineae bacterium]
MNQQQTIEHITQIKSQYEEELMSLANVVGVGVGFKYKNGQPTDEIALVVNVSQKKSITELSEQDVIPPELEGVPVDVQEVGKFWAF